jgi:hypothetical protein
MAALPFILLMGYTWLCPFGYMDEEFPSWHYTKMVEEGKEGMVDITNASLILGDSRAMADIIPELCGENYVNLGVGGATTIEMYYTLKHYIENNGAPARVFIMFAPFHYSYMDNYKTRTMYFHHLDYKEAMEVYAQARTAGYAGAMPDSFEELDTSRIISIYLRSPSVYLPAIINARGAGRLSSNREIYSEQVINRGHALYGTMDGCDYPNYEASYEYMSKEGDHRLITAYFGKLLRLCSDNGIKTTVLQAPMNKASYDMLHGEYVAEYTSYMKAFAGEYKDICFETEIPCYDNKYFGDSSHLNDRGARVYTEELIDKYADYFEL